MIRQGQKHPDGQMIASANYDGRIHFGKPCQGHMRIRGLRLIDDNEANIFARNATDDAIVAANLQLVEMNRNMCRLFRNFDRAFDHEADPLETKDQGPSMAN
jgi:hypothetical protein